jgi:hypothetical protein
MSILKKTEVQFDRSTDPFWWGLAAVLGLVSLWLPQLLQSADHTTQVVLSESALFFSGALIGSLRPDRVWRWGVAAFLAFAIRDMAKYANQPSFTWASNDVLFTYLLANCSVYIAHTVPVVAGAYLGSYLTRGPLR